MITGFHAARPLDLAPGEGTDLGQGWQLPFLNPEPEENFKPQHGPLMWSAERMKDWLIQGNLKALPASEPESAPKDGYLYRLPLDTRWHVQIDSATSAAKDERLFMTSGLAFPEDVRLAMRFESDQSFAVVEGIHPLGGERRVASWNNGAATAWQCPFTREFEGKRRVRLVLATPGLFRQGWRPDWLQPGQPSKIPGTAVEATLISACVERPRAISGFSLDANNYGRKPVRWLAPAGSVYFLELSGDLPVHDLWLRSVSDLTSPWQNGPLDGFGLALWGLW